MPPLLIDSLEVLLSLGLILLAAELFTNAVEWLGHRLKLDEGAVGSVLAAVGTALPETIIPVVAIITDARAHKLFTPQSEAQSVSMGAIIGAPFMLGTLALALIGVTYVITRRGPKRSDDFNADPKGFRADAEFFMLSFSLGAGMGLLRHFWPSMPQPLDWLLGIGLIGLYVMYLKKSMTSGEHHAGEEPHALFMLRAVGRGKQVPATWLIALQLFAALAVMFVGAEMFVAHLTPMALTLGVPSLILALLIVPVATELPEKFNSVLWVSRGKDTLALGNISGALVFQSTFPVTLGLCFLKWDFGPSDPAFISAVLGLLGVLAVYIGVRVTGKVQPALLIAAGGLYALYLVLIVLHLNGVLHLDVNAAAEAATTH